jgi:DNA adenine methylase
VTLRAPFPWFGGKSRVSSEVWTRFGDVRNYVEPFAGSLAVLLGRPSEPKVETVNDKDCYLANFWRAVQQDPEQVAFFADSPVNEADLHARHLWLVSTARARAEAVMSDPDHFDAKVAGWWVWGLCAWIGTGWCAEPGWRGRGTAAGKPRGVSAPRVMDWQPRPDLSSASGRGAYERPALTGKGVGVGVHSKLLKAGRTLPGVHADITHATTKRQIPNLAGDSGAAGRGIHASRFDDRRGGIYEYFAELSTRLRRVRVCCGDWSRVLGPAVTTCIGTTAVFLDPPYHGVNTERELCYTHDEDALWQTAKDWALVNCDDPNLRIALCGYEGEHGMPDSWECLAWKSAGGYGRTERGQTNRGRERIWFSPACLRPGLPLFEGVAR